MSELATFDYGFGSLRLVDRGVESKECGALLGVCIDESERPHASAFVGGTCDLHAAVGADPLLAGKVEAYISPVAQVFGHIH